MNTTARCTLGTTVRVLRGGLRRPSLPAISSLRFPQPTSSGSHLHLYTDPFANAAQNQPARWLASATTRHAVKPLWNKKEMQYTAPEPFTYDEDLSITGKNAALHIMPHDNIVSSAQPLGAAEDGPAFIIALRIPSKDKIALTITTPRDDLSLIKGLLQAIKPSEKAPAEAMIVGISTPEHLTDIQRFLETTCRTVNTEHARTASKSFCITEEYATLVLDPTGRFRKNIFATDLTYKITG